MYQFCLYSRHTPGTTVALSDIWWINNTLKLQYTNTFVHNLCIMYKKIRHFWRQEFENEPMLLSIKDTTPSHIYDFS